MKEICLVTHTQATHHVERRVGGWYDSPLTDKGRVDARACGLRLVDLGWSVVRIFTSDLKRTRQMAQILSDCLKSPIQYDARLREMSFGTAEGKAVDKTGPILSSRGTDRLDFRNEFGGETKRELATRLYEAMDEIAACDRAIICTHGYAATFLIACWIRMPLESVGYVNFRVPTGSITLLSEDELRANRIVERLGDTSHLDGREIFV